MKGIKCTSNEVNAILAGNKSQIRLIGKHKDFSNEKCPHQIGDLVFVKEDFLIIIMQDMSNTPFYKEYPTIYGDKIEFIADGAVVKETWPYMKRKPAQHMKQHQSRITLRIKDISVERLQSISDSDCWAEGVCDKHFSFSELSSMSKVTTLQSGFRNVWNATHKKPEEKFEANPWIWRIEFEVVK